MNISATLNTLRLITNPSLCVPQIVAPNFNGLQIPFHSSIKAVVVDKDNCISKDKDDKVYPEYLQQWETLKKHYPGERVLIVSNSAGTNDDTNHEEAMRLEKNTGVKVLRHSTKKPGCYNAIMQHFYDRNLVQSPAEVAVIGDRLLTDVLMANMMGAKSVWLSEGVVKSNKAFCRLERFIYSKVK